MCLGQHGHVLPLFGIVVQLFYQLLHQGVIDLLQGFLEGKGNAGVVDILGSEAEVDEL